MIQRLKEQKRAAESAYLVHDNSGLTGHEAQWMSRAVAPLGREDAKALHSESVSRRRNEQATDLTLTLTLTLTLAPDRRDPKACRKPESEHGQCAPHRLTLMLTRT